MNFSVLLRQDPHIDLDYHSEGCDLLRQEGQVDIVTIQSGDEEEAMEEFLSLLKTSDAAVIGPWYRPAMQAKHWQGAENLKVFSGTFGNRFADWVDFDLLESRAITLIDTSRSMTPSVAEFALAMTLNLIRDIPQSMYHLRAGKWKDRAWTRPGFVYNDLTGRSVGLAGFGSINRRYAELLQPFRCKVKTYDPFIADVVLEQYGVGRAKSLVELAASSEVFVVGLPPTPTTLDIISRDVIFALPKGSLFVLVTRMAVVEQEALWARIADEDIAAAIDVYDPEPPPADSWFLHHRNVLATPHIAGGVDFCHRRCFTDACKDAIAVLAGRKPNYPATKWDYLCYEGKLESPL